MPGLKVSMKVRVFPSNADSSSKFDGAMDMMQLTHTNITYKIAWKIERDNEWKASISGYLMRAFKEF